MYLFLCVSDLVDQTVFDLASDAAMKQVLQGGAQRVRCPPQGFITNPMFLFPHLSLSLHQLGCCCQEARRTPPQGEQPSYSPPQKIEEKHTRML